MRKVSKMVALGACVVVIGLIFLAYLTPHAHAAGQAAEPPVAQTTGNNILPAAGSCGPASESSPPSGDAHAAMAILPSTRWQPYGGDVQFELSGIANPLSNITVYFAWADPNGKHGQVCVPSTRVRLLPMLDSDDANTYRYAARVPELDHSWISGLHQWHTATTVPLADMYVAAFSTADQAPLGFVASVGISTPWLAFAGAILGGVIVWATLAFWTWKRDIPGRPFIGIISTPNGVASLSQFQILIWTFVIGIGVVYVMMLSGNLIDIPTSTLGLLGVTGFALVGSKLVTNNDGSPQFVSQPSAVTPASAITPTMPREPKWSDLVIDVGTAPQVDLARLQMLVFTTITAVFTALTLFNTGVIPDLPVGELALVGISNGVYLASKVSNNKAG